MLSRRSIVIFSLVFGCWAAGGATLYSHLIERSNAMQLQELSQQLAGRAENALDFVVIAKTELLVAGRAACTEGAARDLGQMALRTGTVSEIFMITPSGVCSGFGGLSASLPDASERDAWLLARNAAYRVGSVQTLDRNALGVSWGFGTDLELVMTISVDVLLFDALPAVLRDYGRTTLFVGYGDGATEVAGAGTVGAEATQSFAAMGARYPVTIDITVDEAALSAWRAEAPPSLTFGWMFFGALFAAIFVRAVVHRDHQEVAQISKALRSREIVPHFQPIVDLQDGAVIGCEALARWMKPSGERIAPAKFVPLVERHGLADRLFETMFRQTAETLGPRLARHPAFRVSFNVTPDQFLEPGFADRLKALAAECAMRFDQICIEVTERQALSSPERATLVTAELSRLGVSVAIDDAGTGYNGLASMQRLSANSLKMDKFFVDHVHSDPRARIMVEMLVAVSQKYGMNSVAEGVEREEQVQALRAAGVKSAQGYFFAPPVPADEMAAFLGWVFEIDAGASCVVQAPAAPRADAVLDDIDEVARVAALRRYQILDTPEEEAFERIPRIIRNALHAPMAAIAFIDDNRRWFKAVAGGRRGSIERSASFCNRTIQRDQPTIIVDTHLDPDFRESQLVVGPPHIRAYLGVPLVTPDGFRIGSVCSVDTKPRDFSKEQVALVQDLSAIVVEQLELRQMALFDSLTAVRSRRGFRSDAEIQLAMADRHHRQFSVMVLDIDHFKSINDGFGHAIGDEVLIGLGARLSGTLRREDIIGRVGGEEFAIALPEINLSGAMSLAERVRKTVADAPFETQVGLIDISVSVGVATLEDGPPNLDALLDAADRALYRAKADGRNCVRAASSGDATEISAA